MAGKHALLSPSAADRWMNCTPSARLEESLPESTSSWAEEGALAHSVAELKVRKQFVEPIGPKAFTTRMNKLKKTALYDKDGNVRDPKDYWQEIQSCTDDYLDYINGVYLSYHTNPYLAVERRLDFSKYVPEGFGTGDCIIIGGNTLHVIDYKHGKGVPVSPENNPQLMLYGLGALEYYALLYDIQDIMLTVFQPRGDGDTVKEWGISAAELIAWGENTVKPLAEKAFKGEGDFCGGDWCRFCRAKNTCRHRAGTYTALEDFGGLNSKTNTGAFPKPPLLSDTEVGELLEKAIAIDKWVEGLKEYALAACLAGKEIPGWKAVEGRGSRSWENQETAFAALKSAGIDDAILYERKPVTAPALEKTLGKKEFAEVAALFVIKQPGKPALAKQSDSRPAISNKPSAEEDFKAAVP